MDKTCPRIRMNEQQNLLSTYRSRYLPMDRLQLPNIVRISSLIRWRFPWRFSPIDRQSINTWSINVELVERVERNCWRTFAACSWNWEKWVKNFDREFSPTIEALFVSWMSSSYRCRFKANISFLSFISVRNSWQDNSCRIEIFS